MVINIFARKLQQASELGIPRVAAGIYEKIAGNKLLSKLHETVVARIKLGASIQYILDVGCGPGHLLSKLLKRYKKPVYAIGMDISPAMVKLARKRLLDDEGPGVSDVVAGDAMRLPFRSSSFNYAVSTGVLHHIPSPEKFFEEIHRVIRRGSLGLVYEFSPDTPWSEVKEASKNIGVNPLLIKIASSMHGIPRREYLKGYISKALKGINHEVNFINIATEVKIKKY